jgi:hypothetical protein
MITKPESGNALTKDGLIAMDAQVRARLNTMPASALRTFSLSAKHGPSLFVGGDVERVTADVTVNTQPATFSDTTAAILADWQDLVDYQVAGAELPHCFLVIWCTLHVKGFVAEPAPADLSDAVDWQSWVNLYYTLDGVDEVDATNTRCVWTQADLGQVTDTREVITIYNGYEVAGGVTLAKVGILAAKNKGGSPAACEDWVIANGEIGWFAFYY